MTKKDRIEKLWYSIDYITKSCNFEKIHANGTAQLNDRYKNSKGKMSIDELIKLAVEYGRREEKYYQITLL